MPDSPDGRPPPFPPPYDLGPPRSAPIGDREVDRRGDLLAGKRVALLVCGGIAALRAPMLARALRRQGAEVTAFLSEEAHRYVAPDALEWATARPLVARLSAHAEHLGEDGGYDAYLVAPATYNTLNKLAIGAADGLLTTTLASALGRMERGGAAVLVAPTMHGSMHNRVLQRSLAVLQDLGVRVIPPRDALGKDNLPDDPVLVAEVARAVGGAPLRGRRVLVTAGLAPGPAVAGLGRLGPAALASPGLAVAEALHAMGAELELVCGPLGGSPPLWIPARVAPDADALRSWTLDRLADGPWHAAALLAAEPDQALQGGAGPRWVARETTAAQVRARHPALPVVELNGHADPGAALSACLRALGRPG